MNLAQKYLHFPLLPKPVCFVILADSICDRDDDIVEICILPRILYFLGLETTSLSYELMNRTSSMPDVEFYRLYNGLWARDLMSCLCRDFCDFHKSLPCFSPVCRDFILSLMTSGVEYCV